MKSIFLKFTLSLFFISFIGCKKNNGIATDSKTTAENTIQYAKGLAIYKYKGFSIVKIKNPWPNASKVYTYVFQEKNAIIPDSLKENPIVQVPIKTIIATSTTHISPLEMLGVRKTHWLDFHMWIIFLPQKFAI